MPEVERACVEGILKEVMRGDVFLEVSYAYDQGAVADLGISLVYDSGPVRELNDAEVQAVLDLFRSVDTLSQMSIRSQYSDESGFYFSISASDLLQSIFNHRLQTHPESLL
jgi:hypothetical protein